MTETKNAAIGQRDLYLDLLKKVLLSEVSGQREVLTPIGRPSSALKRALVDLLRRRGLVLADRHTESRADRIEGRIWPLQALTMIGRERLDNLQRCIDDVAFQAVPGDFIEAGVWRGGASIFARAALDAYGLDDRTVWLADSFAGLPAPDARYPADAGGTFHTQPRLAVSLEDVQANFERLGFLSDRVRFLKGWFSETLPETRDQQWSIIRLDGDMYESTMDSLKNLYPNLSPGGWSIIDDYDIEACKQAVHDYRAKHAITEPIQRIDWTGVCWQRAHVGGRPYGDSGA